MFLVIFLLIGYYRLFIIRILFYFTIYKSLRNKDFLIRTLSVKEFEFEILFCNRPLGTCLVIRMFLRQISMSIQLIGSNRETSLNRLHRFSQLRIS